MTREAQVAQLAKLLQVKGAQMARQLAERIRSGEALTTGQQVTFEVDILQEALRQWQAESGWEASAEKAPAALEASPKAKGTPKTAKTADVVETPKKVATVPAEPEPTASQPAFVSPAKTESDAFKRRVNAIMVVLFRNASLIEELRRRAQQNESLTMKGKVFEAAVLQEALRRLEAGEKPRVEQAGGQEEATPSKRPASEMQLTSDADPEPPAKRRIVSDTDIVAALIQFGGIFGRRQLYQSIGIKQLVFSSDTAYASLRDSLEKLLNTHAIDMGALEDFLKEGKLLQHFGCNGPLATRELEVLN